MAFNSERGGVIECLKEDKIVDLDSSKLASHLIPELLSTKAMVTSWLADAVQYELWVATDRSVAHKIYFSDLPWPIGKVLHWKKSREVKQLLNITNVNAEEKAEEVSVLLSFITEILFIYEISHTYTHQLICLLLYIFVSLQNSNFRICFLEPLFVTYMPLFLENIRPLI